MKNKYYGLLKVTFPTNLNKFKALSLGIKTKCTGNPLSEPVAFPLVNPILTKLGLGNTALQAVSVDPGASSSQIQDAYDNVENVLKDLAVQLEVNAKGDLTALGTTGFELKKTRVVSGDVVAAPEAPKLTKKTGYSGKVYARAKKARGVGSIVWEYSQDNWATKVTGVVTIGGRLTIAGLIRGKDVQVRCWAVGAKGPGGVGPDSSIMVD